MTVKLETIDLEKTYTIEEFMALPDDGRHYELVEGKLVEMSPASGEHGEIGVALISYLAPYVRQGKLGRVFSVEAPFVLDFEAKIVRAPDVAFVKAGRLPAGPIKGEVPLPPDLAVEIISPSDRLTKVRAKVKEYQQSGVQLVWVINPRKKIVEVYHPSNLKPLILSINAELDGEDVIPGFKLSVKSLFE